MRMSPLEHLSRIVVLRPYFSSGLVAIRFVKYSADEQNWLRRVGEKRDTELKWLLKTRINNLVSVSLPRGQSSESSELTALRSASLDRSSSTLSGTLRPCVLMPACYEGRTKTDSSFPSLFSGDRISYAF